MSPTAYFRYICNIFAVQSLYVTCMAGLENLIFTDEFGYFLSERLSIVF